MEKKLLSASGWLSELRVPPALSKFALVAGNAIVAADAVGLSDLEAEYDVEANESMTGEDSALRTRNDFGASLLLLQSS